MLLLFMILSVPIANFWFLRCCYAVNRFICALYFCTFAIFFQLLLLHSSNFVVFSLLEQSRGGSWYLLLKLWFNVAAPTDSTFVNEIFQQAFTLQRAEFFRLLSVCFCSRRQTYLIGVNHIRLDQQRIWGQIFYQNHQIRLCIISRIYDEIVQFLTTFLRIKNWALVKCALSIESCWLI